VGIGSVFATVEEFLTVVVLRRDVPSYVFTILILFPIYLTVVFVSSRWIDRIVRAPFGQALAHLLAFGWLGLMLEWFLMGLSPWSNPEASRLLMLGFQVGMFAFWATVATAPRMFLDGHPASRLARRRTVRLGIPYLVLVYTVAFVAPARLRFGPVILLIVAGYTATLAILGRWILDLHHSDAGNDQVQPMETEVRPAPVEVEPGRGYNQESFSIAGPTIEWEGPAP
jgi:hypothetical protein